ncbi:asparagine synthase (glutamine-hydrolyzing) [Desulforhabdus sp. TSK]|uniref:asparagine synthase (glutamine-hydrolyzing) n=1 Tax=Desulforhabdus sp. TSK TaxID=2925014 RepID=UPI001FC85A7F|nr:asparagine synthase (glutamine-hydrolyzing) [Desulforhabdus sp. TSK]GKT10886.1 asparagine synthetase B [Desulforhabdus sp. TSK]
MCGIAGFLRSCVPDADEALLKRMGEAIRHRGPDASGEYLDDHVGLAHRRLSIVDLSPKGNQPMFSADSRYAIVFNGEIYNFLDLRKDLEKSGTFFRSRTDTEVILALYAAKGAACLDDFNGMFAFAIWDKLEKKIFLARDRIGKKPLYYYHGGGDRFAFASEIKSLLLLPCATREIEPTAIVDFLKYLYVPDPKSIFRNIYKLPPGHCMEIQVGGSPRIRQYWDVDFSRKREGSIEDAAEELLHLLQDATQIRMIADVPLGAFLSGGIDSSAVVAMMAQASREKVKTCSIGFHDKDHDETVYAQEIADLFHTDHREYFVEENLAETVTKLPRYFDEPFADSSAVPTYHVSRLARQNVTVALAGDGGDESFGGYEKYTLDQWEDWVRRSIPHPLLRLVYNVAQLQPGIFARKVRTLIGGALVDPGRAYYWSNTFVDDRHLKLLLSDSLTKQISGYDPAEYTLSSWDKMRGADLTARMLYTDLKTYLPGDILAKVDRMSMAHSLEVRAPLLDYRVVEFAASLPSHWKVRGSTKKFILKQTFRKVLPESILHRRKHGFTVPLDEWFRGDLKSMTEEVLLRDPAMEAYFSRSYLQRVWREHQENKTDRGALLWSFLSFALWQREYNGQGQIEPI